jgi:CheY-like chemotaxis protein
VLINLLGNAIKFTEQGRIVVTVASEPRTSERIPVRFSVSDTGIGIAADKTSHIFGAFAQEDTSTTRKYGGTGLGLSICKRLVELMGGQISVQSEPGKGSIFEFTALMTRARAASGLEANAARGEAVAAPQASALAVLLAEDNPVNQKLAQTMLGRLGHTVSVANDGAQALEMVMAQRFDVVLMDMQMPVMDGLEATRRIRAWEADSGRDRRVRTPIIAMTANALERDRDACLEAGMDDHIAKPITRQALEARISAAREALAQG